MPIGPGGERLPYLEDEQGVPPELMQLLGGGLGGGDIGGGLTQAAVEEEEEEMSPEDHVLQAIEHLQAATVAEPDNADSRMLAKTVSDLYAVISAREDAKMSAMGGNPKQLRAMGRAQA